MGLLLFLGTDYADYTDSFRCIFRVFPCNPCLKNIYYLFFFSVMTVISGQAPKRKGRPT